MKKILFFFEEVIPIVSLMAIFVACILQVIMRYIFRNALDWPEEFSLLMIVSVIYMGSIVTAREGRHLAIDVLKELFGPKIRIYIIYISTFFMIVFCLIYGWLGLLMTDFVRESGQESTVLLVPIWIFYPLIPLGMLGTIIRSITHAREEILLYSKKIKNRKLSIPLSET